MPRGDVANFIPKNIITRSLGPHADGAGRSGRAVSARGRRHISVVQRRPERPGQGRRDRRDAFGPFAAAKPLACWSTWPICAAVPTTSPAIVARVLAVPTARRAERSRSRLPPMHPHAIVVIRGCGSSWRFACWWLWRWRRRAMMSRPLWRFAGRGDGRRGAGAKHGLASRAGGRRPMRWCRSAPGPMPRSIACPMPRPWPCLCQMAQQLREAAKDEHWTLDWGRFNAFGEQAQAAVAARRLQSRDPRIRAGDQLHDERNSPPAGPQGSAQTARCSICRARSWRGTIVGLTRFTRPWLLERVAPFEVADRRDRGAD